MVGGIFDNSVTLGPVCNEQYFTLNTCLREGVAGRWVPLITDAQEYCTILWPAGRNYMEQTTAVSNITPLNWFQPLLQQK